MSETPPVAVVPKEPKQPGAMSEHARHYAGAYAVLALFIAVTILQSFVSQFAPYKDYTRAQLSDVTYMQWAFAASNTLISAGVVVLAFLNQSVARANSNRDREKTPSPFPR